MEMIIFMISALNEEGVGYLKIEFDEMPVMVVEQLFTRRTPDLLSLSSGFLAMLP
jgi:hypothetical protein